MSNINQSTKLDKCLITGNPVVNVLDLGQHAYADTFIDESQVHLSEPVFPLQVCLNAESGHLQLGYASNAEERYNLYSYSYTSSNSAFARNHWDNYAAEVKTYYKPKGLVVEVGSNDGYLLGQFINETTEVLGVDSSKTMVDIATTANIPTMQAVFSTDIAETIRKRHGAASVVIANNVFNHANDPLNFAQAAADLIDDEGHFIFEMPYWRAMVESGRFVDMVYHEHISYFTVKGVATLLAKVGLEIEDFKVVDYHGGSLRVVARKITNNSPNHKVLEAIEEETNMGLFDIEFYKNLEQTFKRKRDMWLAEFYRLRENEPDAVIIGVGAAAKANTWLTWHGLRHGMIDYVTDSSAFKQGKYTPLSRIPIRSDNEFANHANPYALILSWNISNGLREAILKINPNTRFFSQ